VLWLKLEELTFGSEQEILSLIEPKTFVEANKYEDWIKSMNEELDQIEKNQTLGSCPKTNRQKCGRDQVGF
jgi:hypothetical protein